MPNGARNSDAPDIESLAPESLVEPDDLVLAYHLSDEQILCFLVWENNVSVFDLPDGAKILALVASLDTRPWQLPRFIGWSDLIPAQVSQLITRARRIFVMPDGVLWRIPFAALPLTRLVGASATQTLERTQAPLVHTLSLTLVNELKKGSRWEGEDTPVTDVLVVGLKDFSAHRQHLIQKNVITDESLSPPAQETLLLPSVTRGISKQTCSDLPYALDEAKTVAALYGVLPLLEEKATREAILARFSSVKVLHFATHAFYQPGDPFHSAIYVAGGPEKVITARDIIACPTSAIVILSCCQTAEGQQIGGEALIGLTYAFLRAGARAVLSTLWKLDDPAAKNLAQGIHESLLAGATIADSLSRVQDEAMRMSHDDTYTSMPFILLGDPDARL